MGLPNEMQERARAAREAARPLPPAPAPKPPAAADWPAPIPLDEPADAVPPFPFDVLPGPVEDLCRAVAEAIYCPPDYPALAALVAASAAIGASFVIEVKAHFRQGASLFGCVVGESSAKKSPPITQVLGPIMAEQVKRVEVMQEAYGDKPPPMWHDGQGELYVSDATVESLAELFQRQPRGLLLYKPELVGWLMAMNQYKNGAGSDRSFFLEVYDSSPITVHRKKEPKSIHVSRPTLAMIGATQPDVVREFFTRRDGLAERILFVFPPSLPARGERWDEVPKGMFGGWEKALRFLWELPMRRPDPTKRPFPNVAHLTPAARPAWQDFTDRLAAAQNDPDCPAQLKPAYGKLEGAAARLALVIQLLGAAFGDPSGDDGIQPRAVEAAGRLALYFGAHAARVQRACGTDDRLAGAKRIVGWAAEGRRSKFTRSELWQALRRNTLFPRPESLGPPLDLLAAHHAVRRMMPLEEITGGGRPPTPTFELNPVLMEAKEVIRTVSTDRTGPDFRPNPSGDPGGSPNGARNPNNPPGVES